MYYLEVWRWVTQTSFKWHFRRFLIYFSWQELSSVIALKCQLCCILMQNRKGGNNVMCPPPLTPGEENHTLLTLCRASGILEKQVPHYILVFHTNYMCILAMLWSTRKEQPFPRGNLKGKKNLPFLFKVGHTIWPLTSICLPLESPLLLILRSSNHNKQTNSGFYF